MWLHISSTCSCSVYFWHSAFPAVSWTCCSGYTFMALALVFPSAWKALSCLPSLGLSMSLYVLLISCCGISYSNTWWLKTTTTTIYYFMSSVGQKFGSEFRRVVQASGLTGGWSPEFTGGSCHLHASWGWASTSKAIPSHVWWISDLGDRSEFLFMWSPLYAAWVSSWHGGWLASPEPAILPQKTATWSLGSHTGLFYFLEASHYIQSTFKEMEIRSVKTFVNVF